MDELDLKYYRSFRNIVKAGDFEIKGEAVLTVASLFKWYEDFEKKLEAVINEKQTKLALSKGKVSKTKPVVKGKIKDANK